MKKLRILMAVLALVLMVGASSAQAACAFYLSADNGDGTCTGCVNTGEWEGMFTGKRYCSYSCTTSRCYAI